MNTKKLLNMTNIQLVLSKKSDLHDYNLTPLPAEIIRLPNLIIYL